MRQGVKREEKASELFLLSFFLATMGGMWNLSSLSRNRTPAPCSESWVSYPLDHQGSPKTELFKRDLERAWVQEGFFSWYDLDLEGAPSVLGT